MYALGYVHDGDSNFEVLQYLSPLSLYNSWGRFKDVYYYISILYNVLYICYNVINADFLYNRPSKFLDST
jgi:hypothetical protein